MAPSRPLIMQCMHALVTCTFISLLIAQGCSAEASENECNNNSEMCEYDCTPNEMERFQCRHNGTSYTPQPLDGGKSYTYCCPGYFKTSNGNCQECNDRQFMHNVNNCCNCLPCKDCETKVNNTIDRMKDACTRARNTVCKLVNDPTPSPGPVCPTVEVSSPETTTIPSGTETTGAGVSNSSSRPTFDNPQKTKSESPSYGIGFYIVLGLLIIILVPLLVFFFYLIILGKGNRDMADGVGNNNVDETWKDALLPIARKIQRTVSCTRAGNRGGHGGGRGHGEGQGHGVEGGQVGGGGEGCNEDQVRSEIQMENGGSNSGHDDNAEDERVACIQTHQQDT